MGYEVKDQGIGCDIWCDQKTFSPLHRFHATSGAHTTFCQMGTVVFYLRCEAVVRNVDCTSMPSAEF